MAENLSNRKLERRKARRYGKQQAFFAKFSKTFNIFSLLFPWGETIIESKYKGRGEP